MVKATAGGGGRGIRLVDRPEELDEAFDPRRGGGRETAGDATVFLERALRGGRHVEVQVVADARARSGRWACATAACSGATRR